jgi:hypothetical protein
MKSLAILSLSYEAVEVHPKQIKSLIKASINYN